MATVAPLLSLPGAAKRLRLFRAELLEEGSYDEAMGGRVGGRIVLDTLEFSAIPP